MNTLVLSHFTFALIECLVDSRSHSVAKFLTWNFEKKGKACSLSSFEQAYIFFKPKFTHVQGVSIKLTSHQTECNNFYQPQIYYWSMQIKFNNYVKASPTPFFGLILFCWTEFIVFTRISATALISFFCATSVRVNSFVVVEQFTTFRQF